PLYDRAGRGASPAGGARKVDKGMDRKDDPRPRPKAGAAGTTIDGGIVIESPPDPGGPEARLETALWLVRNGMAPVILCGAGERITAGGEARVSDGKSPRHGAFG